MLVGFLYKCPCDTIRVRKDLQESVISTSDGVEVDNDFNYPTVTITSGITDDDISAIFINDEWHPVNNIDFE